MSKKKKTAKGKRSKQLTELELAFVANYRGNQVEAARAAGIKDPKKKASTIYNRPRVREAIEKKISALVNASGQKLGKAITVTRNDIINRLDRLSENAETDSVKVSALAELVKVFGLSAKDAKGDIFQGWTDEEYDHYARTGNLPVRYGPVGDQGGSEKEVPSEPAGEATPAKRS